MAATEREKRKLKTQAMTAACTLLGLAPAAGAAESEGLNVDTSIFHYSEAGRIAVTEPKVGVTKNFSDRNSLGLLILVDTISGSTPIGTSPVKPSGTPVTTTSPSGHTATSSPGVVIPMAKYKDTRYGVDGSWKMPLGPALTAIVGGQTSAQSDYVSSGGSLSLAADLNQKDTTVLLGVSPEFDTIKPHGGVPVAFSSQLAGGPGRADKRVLGLLAGLTQVIDRHTLMQWNYAQTRESGDLTDPYKQLSLLDSGGNPVGSVYEKRPSTRLGHSFYWLTKYSPRTADSVSASYRFFTDDWGIRSHTVDLDYHFQFNDQGYLEPHLRFYHQSAVDFYTPGLLNGAALPSQASADYRLAQFNAITIGMRYGWTFEGGSVFAVRVEYYTQMGDKHTASAIGVQKDFDLFPKLQATMFQLQYSFDPARLFQDAPAG